MAISTITTTTTYTMISLVPNTLKASMGCLLVGGCGRGRDHGRMGAILRCRTTASLEPLVELGREGLRRTTSEGIVQHPANGLVARNERVVAARVHDAASGFSERILGHPQGGK
jgi:hypothetical protein